MLTAARERPQGRLFLVERETLVPAPLDEAFAFFSDARNLGRITPPWLDFKIKSAGDLTMREGLLIDYRISLHGIPIPWRTRIDVWEPGARFVDRQVRGPYVWWWHEHRFEAAGSRTRVIDRVEYLPRAAWLSGGFVQRDVERIFNHRMDALPAIFAR